MKKHLLLTLGVILSTSLVLAACSESGSKDAQTNEENNTEVVVAEESKSEEIVENAAPASLNGTYKNSDKGVLVISKYVAGKGFSYKYTDKSSNECGGIEYGGVAKFTSENEAIDEDAEDEWDADKFRFFDGGVNFEPSASMAGMECQMQLDTEFYRD